MSTILILEDERTIADMLVALLEEEGYRVIVAHNGQEGLGLLEQARPDLILCDLMMPVLDGWGFYRHLQERPSYRQIPLVFISAVPEAIKDEIFRYAALIRKPFDLNQLLNTVSALLNPC